MPRQRSSGEGFSGRVADPVALLWSASYPTLGRHTTGDLNQQPIVQTPRCIGSSETDRRTRHAPRNGLPLRFVCRPPRAARLASPPTGMT